MRSLIAWAFVCVVSGGLVSRTLADSVVHDTYSEFSGGSFVDSKLGGTEPSPAISNALDVILGDGRDGAVLSGGTYQPGICRVSGNQGSSSLAFSGVVSGSSIVNGDYIFIHQSAGSSSGFWEVANVVAGGGQNSGTWTLAAPLQHTYTYSATWNVGLPPCCPNNAETNQIQAQAIKMAQYSGGTIGGTLVARDWDGRVGGIVAFMSNSPVNITGTVSVNGGTGGNTTNGDACCPGVGGGFRGGWNSGDGSGAGRGEGYYGPYWSESVLRNYSGGGGGHNDDYGNGGGGGNGTDGGLGEGRCCNNPHNAEGGWACGNPQLTSMFFGGGGGGSKKNNTYRSAGGGSGGGIVVIFAPELTVSGYIQCIGGNGGGGDTGGGGGAGGSILLKSENLSLSSNRVLAYGGSAGSSNQGYAGAGGTGRIRCEYSSVSGSTNPAYSGASLPYKADGMYMSAPIDITGCTSLDTLEWTGTGTIQVQTRTAATSGGLTSAAWSDPLSVSGSPITSVPDDWVQYLVTLSGSTSSSPVLNSVTISYGTVVLPTVLQHPEAQFVCPATTVQFSVTADDGFGTLSYQWQKDEVDLADGGDISGATSAMLQVDNVEASDAGSYRCVVSNEAGEDTSDPAALTVNAPPTIDQGAGPITFYIDKGTDCPLIANQVDLSGADLDLDLLTWSVKTGSEPATGTVSFIGGDTGPAVTICYDPQPTGGGPDPFVIEVTDVCAANTAEIQLQPILSARPVVTAWRSVRTHSGGGGELAIPLSATAIATESRRFGIQRVEVEFSEPVEAADGTLDADDVVVTNEVATSFVPTGISLVSGGQVLRLSFNNGVLADQHRYTFDVGGQFRSVASGLLLDGDGDCQARSLLGDVNDSGNVNLIDVGAVKTRTYDALGPGTARFDLNLDGAINVIDIALAKSNHRHSAP